MCPDSHYFSGSYLCIIISMLFFVLLLIVLFLFDLRWSNRGSSVDWLNVIGMMSSSIVGVLVSIGALRRRRGRRTRGGGVRRASLWERAGESLLMRCLVSLPRLLFRKSRGLTENLPSNTTLMLTRRWLSISPNLSLVLVWMFRASVLLFSPLIASFWDVFFSLSKSNFEFVFFWDLPYPRF